MDLFRDLNISVSAMLSQKVRLNTIASNLANIETTRTPEGGPYRRKDVVFQSVLMDEEKAIEGVEVAGVVEDPSPFKVVYDPSHPDADERGYVLLPNVNMIEEMVNMVLTTRAYEANVNAFNITKTMYLKALELGR
ncbi:MAG: flagellar basal body rod protein FlgC [Nitrospirae bacterium]|nr:MAG: flagellar basal body rod protein FlgC [Nitrospirota bacterium]